MFVSMGTQREVCMVESTAQEGGALSTDRPKDSQMHAGRSRGALQDALDAVERRMIEEALRASKGNMAKAARQLGITERVMGLRVAKHGLQPRQYRTEM